MGHTQVGTVCVCVRVCDPSVTRYYLKAAAVCTRSPSDMFIRKKDTYVGN